MPGPLRTQNRLPVCACPQPCRQVRTQTVQARILKYAQEIGWAYMPRDEAERRRGFDPDGATPEERTRKASLFFGDLVDQLMTAQLRGRALELPKLTLFTAKGAR